MLLWPPRAEQHAARRRRPRLPAAGRAGRRAVRRPGRGRGPGRGGPETGGCAAGPADRHAAPADRADRPGRRPRRPHRRGGLALRVAGRAGPLGRRGSCAPRRTPSRCRRSPRAAVRRGPAVRGSRPVPGAAAVELGQLEHAQDAAAQILAERISAAPGAAGRGGAGDDARPLVPDPRHRLHHPADRRVRRGGQRARGLAPARDAGRGQPGQAGRAGWLRSGVSAATDFGMAHSGVRSVWFRNSIRGAVGLAVAVFIAQQTGLQHSFWVVLGTLSVLRSNALGTGRSVLSALIGTAVGILIGAAILIPVHGNTTVLWARAPGGRADRRLRAPGHLVRGRPGRVHRGASSSCSTSSSPPAGRWASCGSRTCAIGFAISLGRGAGVLAARAPRPWSGRTWPRPTRSTADYVAAMVERLTGLDGGRRPAAGRAGRRGGGAPAGRLVQPVPGGTVGQAGRPGPGRAAGRRGRPGAPGRPARWPGCRN